MTPYPNPWSRRAASAGGERDRQRPTAPMSHSPPCRMTAWWPSWASTSARCVRAHACAPPQQAAGSDPLRTDECTADHLRTNETEALREDERIFPHFGSSGAVSINRLRALSVRGLLPPFPRGLSSVFDKNFPSHLLELLRRPDPPHSPRFEARGARLHRGDFSPHQKEGAYGHPLFPSHRY